MTIDTTKQNRMEHNKNVIALIPKQNSMGPVSHCEYQLPEIPDWLSLAIKAGALSFLSVIASELQSNIEKDTKKLCGGIKNDK